MEIQLIYLIIFVLAILQTIVGVGVLVLGTPILLILNYNILEIINLLLPISIMVSLSNYIYLKYNKKKLKINLDKNIKKIFIVICVPGISIGLILAREFFHYINFEILVSIIIIMSLIIKHKYENLMKVLPLTINKIVLILISVIHGLTNSGGTLLTIFFTSFDKNKKNQSRYSVTFYYLILVLVQYMLFLIVFKKELLEDYPFQIILFIIPALLIGNIVVKKISENFFKKIIELLALLSAAFLLLNN
ncbi:TSUP family transporter [Candidatus Pelagibacter sp.]|jgi:uncharacterized protein|nr:TSUP family transporter [Candidatus Pelagibacter sp.]